MNELCLDENLKIACVCSCIAALCVLSIHSITESMGVGMNGTEDAFGICEPLLIVLAVVEVVVVFHCEQSHMGRWSTCKDRQRSEDMHSRASMVGLCRSPHAKLQTLFKMSCWKWLGCRMGYHICTHSHCFFFLFSFCDFADGRPL